MRRTASNTTRRMPRPSMARRSSCRSTTGSRPRRSCTCCAIPGAKALIFERVRGRPSRTIRPQLPDVGFYVQIGEAAGDVHAYEALARQSGRRGRTAAPAAAGRLLRPLVHERHDRQAEGRAVAAARAGRDGAMNARASETLARDSRCCRRRQRFTSAVVATCSDRRMTAAARCCTRLRSGRNAAHDPAGAHHAHVHGRRDGAGGARGAGRPVLRPLEPARTFSPPPHRSPCRCSSAPSN